MPFAGGEEKRLRIQFSLGASVLADRQRENRGVEVSVSQQGKKRCRLRFRQLQGELRERPSDGRQYLRQQVGRDGGDDAEPQLAAERVAMLLGDLHEFVRIAQHARGLGDDGLSHRRQHHPAVAPLDQRHAESLFQLLDLGGQGRLADKTGVGGAAEVTMLGNRHQVLKIAQVHGR